MNKLMLDQVFSLTMKAFYLEKCSTLDQAYFCSFLKIGFIVYSFLFSLTIKGRSEMLNES